MEKKIFSVVVSVFNEEAVIPQMWQTLQNELLAMQTVSEVIFVNDGSNDNSREILQKIANDNEGVKVVHFSRNFGHEAAMIAGIDHAVGDAIVCMDADLQHPPTMLNQMYELFTQGFDIVNMVRMKRDDASLIQRLTSKYFYKLLNSISAVKIEPNASDFFLLSKRVAQVLKTDYRERTRFLRGLIQNLGFKKTTLEYNAPERAAGQSKYSLFKLLIFSAEAIASTSQMPLRFSILIGLLFGGMSFIVGIYSIAMRFLGNPFSGYTTIVVLISFAFSLLFFILGIMGEYIGKIFAESKQRPLYIVDKIDSCCNNVI